MGKGVWAETMEPSCAHRNQGHRCKKDLARKRVYAPARASLSPEVFKLEAMMCQAIKKRKHHVSL